MAEKPCLPLYQSTGYYINLLWKYVVFDAYCAPFSCRQIMGKIEDSSCPNNQDINDLMVDWAVTDSGKQINGNLV
ncbi:MAG TPA: hypothetical protein VEL11_06030 [Candidatus Bathyarchaeia archaeon]|nr:hypothetical protein [Candidatus Bathyarchaeia archaeon]